MNVRCMHRDNNGFTLVELVIVIGILGTLAAIAVPSMQSYVNKSKTTKAIIEIKTIETELVSFYMENEFYPPNLDAIGLGNLMDPWNNPYEYLRIEGDVVGGGQGGQGGKGGKDDQGGSGGSGSVSVGQLRKDRNLVPINTDFDLFSKGPDGQSVGPLTAKISRDDIVRANNGSYIGLGSGY